MVSGVGGIGKTALVVRWAHLRARNRHRGCNRGGAGEEVASVHGRYWTRRVGRSNRGVRGVRGDEDRGFRHRLLGCEISFKG